MQKIWKKFAAIVSLLCLTLAIALFAACGNDDGGDKDGNNENGTTVTYTLKIVLPGGTPVGAGYIVSFCDENGCPNVRTNADGVATYTGKKGVNYHVQVNTTPEGYVATGYTVDDSTCYTNDWNGTSYTVTLTPAVSE